MKTYQTQCLAVIIPFLLLLTSCEDSVEIPPPVNSITTTQTFADSSNANAAISGIYSQMISSDITFFSNGCVTLAAGLSADELVPFDNSGPWSELYSNSLIEQNGVLLNLLWSRGYARIYQTNATIEGLNNSDNLKVAVKERLIAEAKMIRAFLYFNLAQLFNNVPNVTSTDWRKTQSEPQITYDEMMDEIKKSLLESIDFLPDDYSLFNNERLRVNKYAAHSLLARIYLYQENWQEADAASTLIINSPLYQLASLDGTFDPNSTEAIWQLTNDSSIYPFNGLAEGMTFIPFFPGLSARYYLNESLIESFEEEDLRWETWVGVTNFNDKDYFYPFKYTVGPAEAVPNGPAHEYYMMLRLAEQYLIRAEARVHLGMLQEAVDDINMIRNRAGLENYEGPLEEQALLDAIMQERRVELFAEWGHRWFDLKRTDRVDDVMSVVTPQKGGTWESYKEWFPIPFDELLVSPQLEQNEGY